ncbi:hypothetical protein J6590_052689 [Homalodisca vitripennis]|nr:hypothetical protein J6590_052689 [Homalodisca vitripennis]
MKRTKSSIVIRDVALVFQLTSVSSILVRASDFGHLHVLQNIIHVLTVSSTTVNGANPDQPMASALTDTSGQLNLFARV